MNGQIAKLGRLLADARKRHNLTLRAVENTVGISNAYLSQLETGKVQSPSPVVLHKLSELYGLSYGTIMREAGYPLPKNLKTDESSSRITARVGQITDEEEDAVVEYLRFLRSQRSRRGRP